MQYYILVSGGLSAVIYTDALQTLVMIVGAFILMVLSKYTMCCKMPSFYAIFYEYTLRIKNTGFQTRRKEVTTFVFSSKLGRF